MRTQLKTFKVFFFKDFLQKIFLKVSMKNLKKQVKVNLNTSFPTPGNITKLMTNKLEAINSLIHSATIY